MLENKQRYANDSTTGVPMLSLFISVITHHDYKTTTHNCMYQICMKEKHPLNFYFIIFDKFIYLKLAYIDVYKAFES